MTVKGSESLTLLQTGLENLVVCLECIQGMGEKKVEAQVREKKGRGENKSTACLEASGLGVMLECLVGRECAHHAWSNEEERNNI